MTKNTTSRSAAIAASILVAAWSHAATAEQASADLKDLDGQAIGTVTLEDTPNGILVHAILDNLPEGSHSFHIHAVGQCEPPFASAGGHFNPTGATHGFLSPTGPHAGDFPNIHVPSSGALEFEAYNPMIALDDILFDADGAAIVIHDGTDDYTTDPAGNAGTRIVCGVIER
jgi:Cu-Zn family superoxide dismutase